MAKKWLLVLLLSVLAMNHSILVSLSKRTGRYDYFSETLVFLSELIKLGISSYFVYHQAAASSLAGESAGSAHHRGVAELRRAFSFKSLPALAPSVLYAVQNNLQYVALLYLTAPSYQVLSNLKVIATGLVFRMFMGKQLNELQWSALLLVAVGSATTQIPACAFDAATGLPAEISFNGMGVFLICIISMLSGLAAIASEILVKNPDESMHFTNIQLYKFGVVINFCILLWRRFDATTGFFGLFVGLDGLAFVVLLNNSFMGLIVSVVLKYADSVLKVYSTSVAMLLTTVVSIYLFDFQASIQLWLGIIVVSVALYLHGLKH